MCLCPRVVSCPRHDPAHLLTRRAACDCEPTTVDLQRYMEVRRRRPDRGELVPESGVERGKVARQTDDRSAARVERCRTSVHVELLRRLHAGVRECPVGGIEWVVDQE